MLRNDVDHGVVTTTSAPLTAASSVNGRRPPATWQIGIAGLAAVGVSFGFARYGYGLFLPEIRSEFGLTVTQVGLIGSATYLGYMAALVLVGTLAGRTGPGVLVALGGMSAAIGTAMVGLASSVTVLAIGLILAGTSPGWVWAPFSDAVARTVPASRQERVLALIPTGTAFGVMVAGPLAIITHGSSWRFAWLVFAFGALAATMYNLRVLPVRPSRRTVTQPPARVGWRWFAQRAAMPLYVTALAYGVVGSVYWMLAVEAVSSAVGPGTHAPALFWTAMGAAGVAGVFAGGLFDRVGLGRAQALLFTSLAVAVALLGVAPGAPAAVAASALLYGPAFMAVSALLAVWSYRVFPLRPTTGFSATVFFLGIGTVSGSATIGALADMYDVRTAFLVTAAVAIVTLKARPRGPAAKRLRGT